MILRGVRMTRSAKERDGVSAPAVAEGWDWECCGCVWGWLAGTWSEAKVELEAEAEAEVLGSGASFC